MPPKMKKQLNVEVPFPFGNKKKRHFVHKEKSRHNYYFRRYLWPFVSKINRDFAVRKTNKKNVQFIFRLFLRQFAIEILQSAFNNLVRQVRRTLERGFSGNDDSFLLWIIRFFLEFNRLDGFKLPLVRWVRYFKRKMLQQLHWYRIICYFIHLVRLWVHKIITGY